MRILYFNFLCLLFFSCSNETSKEVSSSSIPSDSQNLKNIHSYDTIEQIVADAPNDTLNWLIEMANKFNPEYNRGNYSEEDELTEDDISNSAVDSFNFYLKKVLGFPKLSKEQIGHLSINAISKDQRIGVINVFENTGGSFQSFTTYTFYKSNDSVYIKEEPGTLGVYSIHTLADGHYIVMGSGVTCSTCWASFINEYKINGSKLETLYNYIAGYRMGNLNIFEYNPETRTFKYDYYDHCTDGLQEGEDMEKCRVEGRYTFKP